MTLLTPVDVLFVEVKVNATTAARALTRDTPRRHGRQEHQLRHEHLAIFAAVVLVRIRTP